MKSAKWSSKSSYPDERVKEKIMPHNKPTNKAEPLKILMGKQFLDGMARIISEIQAINLWIDDARTNRIARIRYQKSKPRLKELVEAHRPLMRGYEALTKEHHPCTSQ